MDKVIAEVKNLITLIAGTEGQEPSVKILQGRLGELYAEQSESDASYRSSRN